jgi:hypothetical protein
LLIKDHDVYPRRGFEVDRETPMLGTVKPYNRQVMSRFWFMQPPLIFGLSSGIQIVISTGRSDWEREITDASGSLAASMAEVTRTRTHKTHHHSTSNGKSNGHAHGKPSRDSRGPAGVFRPSDSARVSTLNGSHRTICDEDDHETVLVFPDFKVVSEVRRSAQGAQDLWDSAVNPELDHNGAFLEKSPLKTWVLPYSCVILLCACPSIPVPALPTSH